MSEESRKLIINGLGEMSGAFQALPDSETIQQDGLAVKIVDDRGIESLRILEPSQG